MCACEASQKALLLLGDAVGSSAGALLERLPICATAAVLPDDLSSFGLAVLGQDVAADRHVIRMLLAARLNFCLAEPPRLRVAEYQRLRQAARKRRLSPIWLSSWRFRSAVAKAREVVLSGCLGAVAVPTVRGDVANDGPDAVRLRDLCQWLFGDAECLPARSEVGAAVSVALIGSLGQLRLELGEEQDRLQVELPGGCCRDLVFSAHSLSTEMGMLLYLWRSGGLPGIFPGL